MMKITKMEEILRVILQLAAQALMSILAASSSSDNEAKVAYLMVDEGEDKEANIDEINEEMDMPRVI